MSLVGMRHALGDALGNAANRKQVEAVISLVEMVEHDFENDCAVNLASASQGCGYASLDSGGHAPTPPPPPPTVPGD